MKYVARVRLRGGYDCIDIQGWYRTPRPHPYDEMQESWWCSWVPETVLAQVQDAAKGTTVRFRFGTPSITWHWSPLK